MKLAIRKSLTRVVPLLAAGLLALLVAAGSSAGGGPIRIGIQPAGEFVSDSPRGAYFEYTLGAGDHVSDEAVVINSGDETAMLKLYAADGVTAINGSTAFAAAGEDRNGVRSWLSTELADLEIRAAERVNVPFTVTVPPDATPGDHVAGWVVEAPPQAGPEGSLATTVTERAGVAVVVRVPGPTNEALTMDRICLNQETGSNYFEVPVRNEGNVLTKGSGTLTLVAEKADAEVFIRPAELGTVLPGDETYLRLDAPFDPGPGKYVANLRLELSSGETVESSSPVDIGNEKANGCAGVASEAMEGERGFFEPLGGATPWLLLGVLMAALAGLALVRAYISRRSGAAGKGD